MFCGKCGSNVPDGNVFCSVCGAPINNSATPPSGQPVMQPVQTVPVVMTVAQPEPANRKNGMATAGLVFGIIASVSSLATLSFTSSDSSEIATIIMFVYGFATLGVIFSAIGKAKSRNGNGKGKAITGLILSICSFLTPVLALGIGTYTEKAKNAPLAIGASQYSYIEVMED